MDKAEKILAAMRNTKAGWKPEEFETLLLHYGFKFRQAGDTFYFHPRFRELFLKVPRHRKLKSVYADKAVKLSDRLIDLETSNE